MSPNKVGLMKAKLGMKRSCSEGSRYEISRILEETCPYTDGFVTSLFCVRILMCSSEVTQHNGAPGRVLNKVNRFREGILCLG